MSRFSLPALGFLAVLTMTAPSPAAPPGDSAADVLQRSRERVAVCADWLASRERLAGRGMVSAGDVDDARLSLAWARCQQAREEGRPEEAVRQLRAVVAVREREWRRLSEMDRRAVPTAELDRARRRLAGARWFLANEEEDEDGVHEQLHVLLAVTGDELKRSEEAARRQAWAEGSLDDARRAAVFVQFLHARAEGRAEDAGRLGRAHLALCERDLARQERAWRRGALPTDSVDFARMSLAEARIRLAVVEGHLEQAREHLRELARVCDRLAERWVTQPPKDPRIAPAIAWKAAFVRARLAGARADLSRLREFIFEYELGG